MDLFSFQPHSNTPLAEKLRPQHFEDILLPEKIKKRLPQLIEKLKSGQLPNLIFWGPPGTGKTSLAMLLSKEAKGEFISINAVDTGAKKLKELGENARRNRLELGLSTFIFIDEIHRLNKSQQDVLLPYTERADFMLIGATTENPSYELNSALLSRCQTLIFQPLQPHYIQALIRKVTKSVNAQPEDILKPDALEALIDLTCGDGRQTLNLLEQIIEAYQHDPAAFPVGLTKLEDLIQQPLLKYDKSSDEHYNCISAFIKSIRGSDATAGLYYLARMIKAGEDPKFIARRLIILASEDVGNADPRALSIATAGLQAVEAVGLPEAGINLAQVVTYLASAPKSNRSYIGYKKALSVVEQTGALPVPDHLKSAQTKFNKNLGFGKNYKYTHDYPKGWAEQNYLPEKIKDSKFYEPLNIGFEKNIVEYNQWKKNNPT